MRTIHLINRKYHSDTTDSMLFTPIVMDVIGKVGADNVCVWAKSDKADIDLQNLPVYTLFFKGLKHIKSRDTVFLTSTPPYFAFTILFLKLFRGFRVIFQVQDLYPDIFKFLGWRFRLLYYLTFIPSYFFYQFVDLFITISDCIKENLIAQYGVLEGKIFVEENWTDIESVDLSEKPITNRVVYIGNIGQAHDYSYFLEYVMNETVAVEIVIKTDNSSKIKLSSSDKIDANGLKQVNLPPFIKWNHTRYSKDELSEFLSGFDYSIVFLGKDFDKILFPCKIYSSLAMLMPVIFFGPEDSFVNIWLEKNNLGFHYSAVKDNYKNLDFYRKNIDRYNKENPIEKKIEHITQIILK